MDEISAATTPESDVPSKRQVKKTKRMLQFEAGEATTQQLAKKKIPKTVPSGKTDKTACPKLSVAKRDKLQDAMQRAKAQQVVCQQMFTAPIPTFDTNTLVIPESNDDDEDDDDDDDDDVYHFRDFFDDDEDHSPVNSSALYSEKAGETSALEKQVKELEAKLQVAHNRISELETARQKSSPPDISVAVTPKKLQLIKDVYHIVESAAGAAPSGRTMGRRGLQMMPKTEPFSGQDRRPFPSSLAPENVKTPPTSSSEELTPLYPGGKPMLTEKSKCIAFSKGKCKESLLYALLTAVFGLDVLARSNALGARQAVNKVGHEEHQPLDKDKLHEIKECVLQRHPLKSGLPCMTTKEFNEKINQKCATARRALKRKLNQ